MTDDTFTNPFDPFDGPGLSDILSDEAIASERDRAHKERAFQAFRRGLTQETSNPFDAFDAVVEPPEVAASPLAQSLKRDGTFDALDLESEVEREHETEQVRQKSAAGVLGNLGLMDEAERATWLKDTRASEQNSEAWWSERKKAVAAARQMLGDKGMFQPIVDYLERKIDSNVAHAKRRQFLVDQMEAGIKEAAKYGAARNIAEQVASGVLETGIGGTIAGLGRASEYAGKAALDSESGFAQTAGVIDLIKGRVIRQFGDWIAAKSRELFPTDEARQEELQSQIAHGAGTMLSLVGPTMTAAILTKAGPKTLGAIAGNPELAAKVAAKQAKVAGTTAGALTGALMEAEAMAQEAEEARAAGKSVSEDDLRATFLWGLPIGATEVLPIANLFSAPQGAILRNTLREMFEESGQEFSQTVLNNIVAQNIYDPERKWDDGAWDAAVVGAILGAHMEGSRRAYQRLRGRTGEELEGTRPQAGVIDLEQFGEQQPIREARVGRRGRATDVEPVATPSEVMPPEERELEAAPEPVLPPAPVLGQVEGQLAASEVPRAVFDARPPQADVSAPREAPDEAQQPIAPARTELDIEAEVEADLPAIDADIRDYLAELGFAGEEMAEPAVRAIGKRMVQGADVATAVAQHVVSEVANDPGLQRYAEAITANKELDKAVEELVRDPEVNALVEQALADPLTLDPYQKLVDVLAGTAPRKAWASELGVSDDELKPLLKRARAEGLVRVDRNGIVRRTAKAKAAAPAQAASASRAPVSDITIGDVDVRDADGGEMFGTKAARRGETVVSALDVSILPDEVNIRYIATREDERRKGYATRLVDDLFREFPGRRITISATTEDGEALFDAGYEIDVDGSITKKSRAPLTIPAEVRYDKAVEAREAATGRPLKLLTVRYGDELEAARLAGVDPQPILDRIAADRDMKKADVHDLAHVVGYAVAKGVTKADALATILARHNDYQASRNPTLDAIAQLEAADAERRRIREREGAVSQAGAPEGLRADEERGEPSPALGGGGPGGAGAVAGDRGATVAQPGAARGLPAEAGATGGDTVAGAGDRGSRAALRPATDTSRVRAEVDKARAEEEAKRATRLRRNYRISDADAIGAGGPKVKVRANIAAIEALKRIEEEGREPSDAEKHILVKYVGWGAFAQDVFAAHKPEWAKERAKLQALLTPEEWKAARASTLNAHFTSTAVIKGMWGALAHLGFTGGRVLEPAAGIGHFIGLTPNALRDRVDWSAVELDSISARITKLLYGAADVREGGFEEQAWPDGFFDVAISNVPFGNYVLEDSERRGFFIHDYFFLKALAKVRPGGIVAFITSSGTLDKLNQRARATMAKRGEFLGAIRLPGGDKGAFKANAGTEVTTDIIFFRVRRPGQPDGNQAWLKRAEIDTPEGKTEINQYFADNPDMMLGKMRLIGSMYGKDEPVLIGSSENIEAKIAKAAQSLPKDAFVPWTGGMVAVESDIDTEAGAIKEGAFYYKDAKLYRKIAGVGQAQKLAAKETKRVAALMGLRDIVNDLLTLQAGRSTLKPERKMALRAALNEAYDAFVAEYGPINTTKTSTQKRKDGKTIVMRRQPNVEAFLDDPDVYKVKALELYDEKTGTARKAAIFAEDILAPYVTPEVREPADALAVSLNEKGRVDMGLIAERLNISEDEAAALLGDQVYRNPVGGVWQTAAQYLAGDVVKKLADAEAAAKTDQQYARNVAALRSVQPEPITRVEIRVPFGAPWVSAEVYQEFAQQIMGASGVKIELNEVTKQWRVVGGYFSTATDAQWGTADRNAAQLLEAALNSSAITITRTQRDGSSVRDVGAEQEAQAKVTAIKEAFAGEPDLGTEGWVWQDEARAQALEAAYNARFNRIVKEEHNGRHLTFPGLARRVTFADGTSATINLSPHRVNAIWRIIQNGNTLLDHAVGAGKTWTSIMAGMEMKRLGQIQRPMYVVPNHMLDQFTTEFYQAYPNAKLLIASKDNMSAKRRREFAARIAAEKWDGIIITHSAFGRLPMSEEASRAYYDEQIAEMEAAKERAQSQATVKDIEKAKKRLIAKLKKLEAKERKDVGVTFEELGVDFLFVDEAHYFKNLWFPTQHTRVKGIANASESQRATDLYMKLRFLERARPGRSAVFMTGTPVSNTMAEMYIMQRYLQHDLLAEYGIAEFDAWAHTFGEIRRVTELAPNGREFRDTESFSRFVNIPELMALWAKVADSQTAEMLKLPRPALKGGKVAVIDNDLTAREEAALQKLIEQMEKLKGQRPEKGRENFLSLFTRGIQLATDERLVDPSAPASETGKIAKAADNIYRIWHKGNGSKTAKAQIVFLDMGVPGARTQRNADQPSAPALETEEMRIAAVRAKFAAEAGLDGESEAAAEIEVDAEAREAEALLAGRFNLYQDLKDRLVAKGIPEAEIAFIHDAKGDEAKAKLFAKVKSGEVRVLIGSTAKMGVGTNVQKLLIAMHHLDAPWRPADVEQRDGRILRQGNLNPEVEIYRYITKRSFDAYRWQILDRKSQFIGQLRAGARGVRTAEDIDPPLPEAAELKAAATGDPRIIEHAELTKAVRELEVAQKVHFKSQQAAKERAKQYVASVAWAKGELAKAKADAAHVVDLKGDAFEVTLNLAGGRSQTVRERKQAGEAIRAHLLALGENSWYGASEADLGDISGFPMTAKVRRTSDGALEVVAAIDGERRYESLPFFLTEATEPVTLVGRWVRLTQDPLARGAELQARIEVEQAEIPKLEAQGVAKAFAKAEQLRDAKARLSALTAALKPKAPAPAEPTLEELERLAQEAMTGGDYQRAVAASVGMAQTMPQELQGQVAFADLLAWASGRRYVVDGAETDFPGVVNAIMRTARITARGPVAAERRAVVVLGLPGSGKSTLSGGFAQLMHAAVLNGDDTKLFIPEYGNGVGSMAVHEEASFLTKVAFDLLTQRGDNLVLEKTGSSPGSISGLVTVLRNAGYRVHLVLTDVPKSLAKYQMVERFRKTGRMVDPGYFDSLQTNDVFNILQQEGAADGYTVIARTSPKGAWHISQRDAAFPGLEDAIERASGGLARVARAGGAEERGPSGGARAGALPRVISEQDYLNQALANLRATSRTAAGVVDVSASPEKAAKMVQGLTGEAAKRSATENFTNVVRELYQGREALPSDADSMAEFIDQVALKINKGILEEGALYRSDDPTKYPYTPASKLELAHRQFAEELSERLADANADPVETAAWIEWRANLTDHFWADGVGKTSKALAYLPLMRAGLPLPTYPDNKTFFAYSARAPMDPSQGGGAYLGEDWQRFLAFYRTLIPSDAEAEAAAFVAPRLAATGRSALPFRPDVLTHLPELAQRIEDEIAAMLPPDHRVRVVDRLFAEEGEQGGRYHLSGKLIELALSPQGHFDPEAARRYGYHEVIHALRMARLFTEQEWKVLVAHAKKVGMAAELTMIDRATGEVTSAVDLYKTYYRRQYASLGLTGSALDAAVSEMMDQELVARLTESYATGAKYPRSVAALMERIARLFKAIRNALSGMGFNAPGDIFDDVRAGRIAARAGRRDVLEAARQGLEAAAFARFGSYRPIAIGQGRRDSLEAPKAGLSDLVASTIRALGIPVRYGRLDPGMKRAAASRGNELAGQFDKTSGVARLALPNDLATLAHEGGHALELRPNLRGALEALKAKHAETLTVPPAPNLPVPTFPVIGFSGLNIFAETQVILADAAKADRDLRAMMAAIGAAKKAGHRFDSTAYDALKRQAGELRAVLVRRLGQMRADAAIADVVRLKPDDPAIYIAQRFSASGAPQARPALAPSARDLSEGFAEFFRYYLTNAAGAKVELREIYVEFEDVVDAIEPALLQQLQDIQEQVIALRTASPAGAVRSRVQSTVIASGPIEALKREYAEKGAFSAMLSDRMYSFYHAFVDARHPMKRAVKHLLDVARANIGPKLGDKEVLTLKVIDDPYKLWRLSEHSKVHATAILQEGVRLPGQADSVGPSFRDALIAAFGGTGRTEWSEEKLELFGSYLVTRRMLAEWERFDRGELEQPPDRVIERAHWQAARRQYEKEFPEFKDGAAILYRFNKNMLRFKHESGFLTRDAFLELNARTDYVPLNRVMEDGSPSSLSAKGTNKRRLLYRFQGSTRDFINPLESIVQDVYATQARVAQNAVIRAMVRLAEAAGPGGGVIAERIPSHELKGTTVDIREALKAAARAQNLSESDRDGLLEIIDDLFDQEASATIFRATETNERGEPIVYLWEAGKRVPIRLGDNRVARDIFEGFVAFGQGASDPITDVLALGTQALRAGITKAPAYLITNLLRDQLATWVLSPHFTPYVTGAKGAAEIAKGGQAAKRYAAFAGLMGGVDAHLIDTAAYKRDVLTLRRKGFTAVPARGGIGQVWQTMLRSLEISEAASRVGHFQAAYQRALKDGMTPEEAAFEAAYAAHDVLDFSRRGAKMASVARIIAFLNASLQGIDAARRTMAGEREAYSNYRDLASPYIKAATGQPLSVAERNGLPNAVRIWVKMALLGMASAALMVLAWDDDEYEEFNDYMRATHWFFNVNGTWLRVPKPFELAVVANAFEAAFARVWKDDARALDQFLNSLKHTFMPPHEVNVANLYYEWKSGKDLFRDRDIVPMHLSKLPPELQFNAYTSELGKLVGHITGLSPQRVDHVMAGLFGTLGRDALSGSDWLLPRLNQLTGGALPGVASEPRAEKSLEDYWVASRLTRRAARGALSTEEFWRQMSASGGEFIAAAEGYKDFKRAGRGREANELLANLSEEEKAFAYLEGEFTEKEQDLHPLNRARQVLSASSGIRKELVIGRLFKEGTKPDARHKDRIPEPIIVAPSVQKSVNEILEDIAMREARNALIVIGHPGWKQKDLMPVDGLVAELKEMAPQVAEEYDTRLKRGRNRVYPFESVAKLWPEARRRILRDGPDADLSDLRAEAVTQ